MKKSLLLTFLVFPFYSSFAQIANHLVISEVFPGGNSSTTADWVELYNPTSQPVDISGWKVKYKSATGASVSNNFTLPAGSTINGYGYFLISSSGTIAGGAVTPDVGSGSILSFSATAGHVALVRDGDASTNHPVWGGILVDLLGYGSTANAPEGSPAASPSATSSLQRKARGGARSGSGSGYDSDNNANDFVVSATPGPQGKSSPMVVPTIAAFSNGYPTVSEFASTSVKINVQMPEDGKTYYVVLPDGAAAPSVSQVKAGKDANGNTVALTGAIDHTLGSQIYWATVSSLMPETAYDIYLVAEYGDLVIQANPVKLDVTTSVVLPVDLLSFNAQWVGNRVQLHWKTASEKHNDRYEVERSADGVVFNYLTSVKGNGTTGLPSVYSVFDERPFAGTGYYRLKQYDVDGVSKVIAETAIQSALLDRATVKVYPNPAVADIFLSLKDAKGSTVEVRLSNLLGQVVHQQKITLVKGVMDYRITPSVKLSGGNYVVTVLGEGLAETLKLMVR